MYVALDGILFYMCTVAPILFPRTMSRGIACVLPYHPLYSLSSVPTDFPYFVLLLGYRSGWLVRMRPTLARTLAGSLAAQYLFAVALARSRANNPSLFLLPRSPFFVLEPSIVA